MPTEPRTAEPQHEPEYRAIFETSSDGLVINDAQTGVVLEANPAFCRMHGYDSMRGLHPRTFIHPDSHHLFDDYVRTVRDGREFRCRARDVRRDGTAFEVEVLGRGFAYHGRPALLGVVRDVTDQVRAYQQLQQQADRRLQQIEALYGADERIYGSLRLDEVLQALVDVASELLEPDKVSVGIWDQQTGRIVVGAARGFSPATTAESVPPDEARQLAEYLGGGLVIMEDVQADPRLPPSIVAVNRREGVRSSLTAPIKSGSDVIGAFGLSYCRRRTFSDEEQRLLAALAQRAAMAIRNARLHQESEQRRHELEALYQAEQALHRSLRLRDVLEALVDTAVDLLHADGAGLWGPEPAHGGRIEPLASRGVSREYLEETMLLRQDAAVRKLWWDEETFAVEDVSRDPRIPPAQRAALEREGFRALLSTRVRVGNEVFGSFTVGHRRPYTFTQAETRLLNLLAQRAGLAIQNARLYEQAQQAATLEERQRLARELHDAVTQTLFSAALIAEVLPALWELDPDEGRQRLAELQRLTRGALAEMRTLLLELRPNALVELPLPELLRQLADATAGRASLAVEVGVAEGTPGALPSAVQVALYRVAQEALNNVVKHAQAQQAAVTLRYAADGGVRLEVADDGRGFDPSAIPGGHLGLGIMRERAEAIGARFRATSRPGEGTTIEVAWRPTEAASDPRLAPDGGGTRR